MKISYASLNDDGKKQIALRLYIRACRHASVFAAAAGRGCTVKTDFLLIGDNSGESTKTDGTAVPFSSSSQVDRWLNTYLHQENVPEERLVWINSHGVDSSILLSVQPKVVIIIGKMATVWGDVNHIAHIYPQIPIISVPHPQFHNKVLSSDPYDLIEVLKCCGLKLDSRGECTTLSCPLSR